MGQAINGKHNITRHARKAEQTTQKAARVKELLDNGLPSIAAHIQTFKNYPPQKNYPPFIELGELNAIMQQELGAKCVMNMSKGNGGKKGTGSNSTELYIYHFFKQSYYFGLYI